MQRKPAKPEQRGTADRQTQREKILTACDPSSPTACLRRQRGRRGSGGRAERCSSATAPCPGCKSHLDTPPLPTSPLAAAAQLARIQQNPPAASTRLCCRLCRRAHPISTFLCIPSSPTWQPNLGFCPPPPGWRWVVDAKGWQGASGGGDGGMPAKALALVARGTLE